MASVATPPPAPASAPAPAPASVANGTPAPPTAPAAPTIIPGNQASYLAALNAATQAVAAPSAPAPAVEPSQPTPVPATASPEPSTAVPTQEAPAPAPATEPAPALDLAEFDFDAAAPAEPTSEESVEPATDPLAGVTPDHLAGLKPDSEIAQAIVQAISEGKEPEVIKDLVLKTSQGRAIYSNHKIIQEVAKPPEQGGLGRKPSAQEIIEGERARLDQQAADYEFGANPISWALNHFGVDPETGNLFRPHSLQALESIPQALDQIREVSPRAYEALYTAYAGPAIRSFLDTQFAEATADSAPVQTKDGKTVPAWLTDPAKVSIVNAVREWDVKLLGRARAIPGSASTGTPGTQPSGADPLAEERARLTREREALASERRAAFSAAARESQRLFQSSVTNDTLADIDKIITRSNAGKVYPKEVLEAFRDRLHSLVLDEVLGNPERGIAPHNPGGRQTLMIQLREASRSPSRDLSAPIRLHSQLVREVLRSSPRVRAAVDNLVSGAKGRSDAQHTVLSQAQSRVEPGASTGAPPSSATVVVPSTFAPPAPGEDRHTWAMRQLSSVTGHIR